jgi:pyruvate dehydrogenase E1 component
MGGTAGRSTLNGEGLQHQDGHSQLIAQTVPNLVSYDPAFAFELALIVRDGIRRMYEAQEDVFYYLTVYNENYPMPPMPDGVEDGVLRGLYRYRCGTAPAPSSPVVNLLAAGSIMQQALAAVPLLEALGCAVHVWSVTSYGELYRDALDCERWNRLHPLDEPRSPYLRSALDVAPGVFVAVSDYMKALGDLLTRWVPGPFASLGTDGYGLSESRPALRRHFEIGPADIALAALDLLRREGVVTGAAVAAFIAEQGIDGDAPSPAG